MGGNRILSQYFTGLGRREFLNWMPDKMYIAMLYRIKTGEKLDLICPLGFNQKMQWLKLYDRNPLYTMLADKEAVKKYISKVLGSEYVIPTLATWQKAEDIKLDTLPDQFVLKCNHDSGSVIICRDKANFNLDSAIKKLAHSLKHTGYWYGREWPYKDINPCIIAEQYIEDSSDNQGLTDYKFFCFNGEPRMLYVSVGLENHSTAQISFYDMMGKEMPFHRSDYKQIKNELVLPDNFDKMVKIAGKLAGEIGNPFVRVDLYPVNEKIYFSEITFYPCNGIIPFEPIEWDAKIGEWMRLPIE